jgi:sec-independent protein translocase protein TatC
VAIAARMRDVQPEDDKRMELTEHLGELRGRIIRCVLYMIAGATLCYFFFDRIYAFLNAPMDAAMAQHPGKWSYVFNHFTSAFFVVLQISVVAGLIVVSPLVIGELYGFIAPALTREERKPLRYVVPFSVCLFAAGVSLAYWVSKFAIVWFVGYVGWFQNAVLLQDPKAYVMFILKMMAVFGAVFQLPVLLMFLAWVGILRSDMMKKSWRHAVVGISVVGLFVTPSNDAFTMLVMIVPVILLYLGSIWLVKLIERKRDKRFSGA